MKIKLNCKEANHICDKKQYNEATFWEKVKLTLHLLYCKICQDYTKRNTHLTKLVKSPKVNTIPAKKSEVLKAQFEEELIKQNQK